MGVSAASLLLVRTGTSGSRMSGSDFDYESWMSATSRDALVGMPRALCGHDLSRSGSGGGERSRVGMLRGRCSGGIARDWGSGVA